MARKPPPAPPIPRHLTLNVLHSKAQQSRACELWRHATQAVLGEGARKSEVMLVGEQPGDKEDLAGKPLVGPAGALLDKALAVGGILRADVYITNAVKHFNWEPRGKIRLHKKAKGSQIAPCRPWLEAEIRLIKPKLIVLMGETARVNFSVRVPGDPGPRRTDQKSICAPGYGDRASVLDPARTR
ncbi:MAG TPA: uracil-DNA glycosylase family protein [Candidatus Binataceae bacterium]|nr:uracil-DNA glycosylase family protein [Candidatus Binataceae bacterium]